ncbi:hypothetical protein [Streptomyces millisiae]|uniref:Uncharacterized protein n=1 Tax=Streptomyces millisiae TaxID=3075542 RepID=A0ABU2LJV4_9ACTN|nr:hypothetical protein [Streptomyces sp. DSM 44918]MDT0317871.1 hypothetical protein [Streptomyces sp. DSM 44918]
MSLDDALSGVRHLLIDFDGPFGSMFVGLPADEVAQRMRRQLTNAGHPPRQGWNDESDPFSLLLRMRFRGNWRRRLLAWLGRTPTSTE